MKKDLYAKLDEILITAMKADFEVHIGGTVDRLDMVHFLKNIVKQHLTAYPDLEKILALRDTVLTARVKRAFPQVEYKRKQIRQDHFRKAYPFVIVLFVILSLCFLKPSFHIMISNVRTSLSHNDFTSN